MIIYLKGTVTEKKGKREEGKEGEKRGKGRRRWEGDEHIEFSTHYFTPQMAGARP